MPAVSVILLAWNSGPLLLGAARSVLDQTMGDLELVLVDNGSSDGAVDELLRVRPDPRIRLLRHPRNLGIAAGLESAKPLCRAPWIALMDADDQSHPLRLELQLRAAAADPALAVIGTGARWMEADGTLAETFPMFYESEDIRRYLPYHMPVLNPTFLGRAEVFREFPHRDGLVLVSDYDWTARVAEHHRIGVVSVPLYHYRRHPGSSTIARSTESFAFANAVRLLTARRQAGRPEDFAALTAEVAAQFQAGWTKEQFFRHFARRCRREGFPLLAAVEAGLAVRERASAGNVLLYGRCLLAALRADRGAGRELAGGLARMPLWTMLRRAGFPGFPRY